MPRLRALLALALLLAVAPAARAEETTSLPSRIVVLSDHTTPVDIYTPIEVRMRLEAADGTPLAGRQLRVWEQSVTHVCCGPPPWRTTGADGVVSITSYPEGSTPFPQEYAAYWYGDATYAKTITEWTQPVVGWYTPLTVSAPAARTSGQALPVTVDVRRGNTGTCVDDTVVEIALTGAGTRTATAVTDAAAGCAVTVELPADVTPGTYTLTASTGHAGWYRLYEPSTVRRTVTVGWQHTFTDLYGRGTARLNHVTKHYDVTLAGGRSSGLQHAGDGMARSGVTGTVAAWVLTLEHDDGAGTSAHGTFSSAGTFTLSGTIRGEPYELSR